jgi:hypothetical protein
MDRDDFLARLRSHPVFADLDDWQVSPVTAGLTSRHASRFRSGTRDYFVKEVQNHEREVLLQLAALHLTHVPQVVCPELLEQNVLVTPFVPSGHLTSKALEPGLIRDYATIQSRLDRHAEAQEKMAANRRFFDEALARCFRVGQAKLDELRRQHDWPVLGVYAAIADVAAEHQAALAEQFHDMPRARLHNDFREENILAGPPQIIADWGSSYGVGPFLHDLAPFCLANRRTLAVFAAHSHVCRAARPEQIPRWVATCAAGRMMARFVYFDEYLAEQDPQQGLAYHLETWRRLPDALAWCA